MRHEILHLLTDVARNSILITGLVVSMMMMIEIINTKTRGRMFEKMRGSGIRQVILSSLLGIIPGCMGGFATVSLYTHRMISFGALTAMMIASSGDEAFIMLAMFPGKALLLSAILFVIAVFSGWAIDAIGKRSKRHSHDEAGCSNGYSIHNEALENGSGTKRTFTFKRLLTLLGLALFTFALVSGNLAHEHAGAVHSHGFHIDLLSEDWMNIMFGIMCIFLLYVVAVGSDHLIEEHLWKHIVKKHLLSIFLWTVGVLACVQIAMHFIDITPWISQNTVIMIFIAALVGLIPESGPHLLFVTLFAGGAISFPVLLASSISQDGHASIPLLAESKRSFVKAKLLNMIIAIACGLAAHYISGLFTF